MSEFDKQSLDDIDRNRLAAAFPTHPWVIHNAKGLIHSADREPYVCFGWKAAAGTVTIRVMDVALDIFFATVGLWTAHQAGAAYILSKTDPAKKRGAVIATLVSVIMMTALIIRS